MADDVIIRICNDLRKWINHSKEGSPRLKEDLIYFDKLWVFLKNYINEVEKRNNKSDEDKDFLDLVKYTGSLYRFHKKYNNNDKKYGIKETDHYVSWTKSNSVDGFYWLYDEYKFILISAKASDEHFGIDLVGLSDYIRKYYIDNFQLGSPAILKEQEVVFPIKFDYIYEVKVNPLGKILIDKNRTII